MKKYSWWGFDENSPPENLKTKRQLSALGLQPGEPIGVIHTPKYDCCLYDPSTCPPKRPLTEKQREAIARKRRLKEQAKWERKRKLVYEGLKMDLDTIPDRIQSLFEEFDTPPAESAGDSQFLPLRVLPDDLRCRLAPTLQRPDCS